ncbi:MAG: YfhO family protein [Candidatus Cloacimonadaceae bacterium]|nr:YfhO family protein [Candidatus Cloacimonadaceae bacterium]
MSKKNVNPKMSHPAPKGKQVAAGMGSHRLTGGFEMNKYLPLILILSLFVLLSAIYFPVAYKGEAPLAGDITQWEGAAKKIIDYNREHSDRALWTQSMFSGMPAYMISFPNRFPFLESLTRMTDKVINWRIFMLFLGGLGIFFLLRHLKMDWLICFAGAVAFIFSCHWVGLLDIGHNTKFRAIMYIPWVIWALIYLKSKPGLLGFGFLATMLIVQLREHHPQISYYLYLFIGMYWVYTLIETLKSKQWKDFAIFTALTAGAFGLTLLAVMNPYLSTMEYSHYTMRGGASGLETSYAQGWSFHPWEIIGLIVPDFFGGINQNYWGWMPFTQIYNYFGIVVLAFGALALSGKHRRLALFLWISSTIFTLMSFGQFSPMLSDLLLKYLPYFNKFRVPSMILTMVQINFVLLAGLGLDTVIQKSKDGSAAYSKGLFKAFWISGAVFIIWLALAKTFFWGLQFTNAGELAQLESRNLMNRLPELKALRLDALYKSGLLSFLFLTVSLGLAYLHSVKKMSKAFFLLLITMIIFIDLWLYTGKHLKDIHPAQKHRNRFVEQDFDAFLRQDESNFRIYPFNVGQVRPAGEWAYHHQSIDGYSAAKLKRYDDLLKVIQGDSKTGSDGEWIRYLRGVFEGRGKETPTPVLDMLSTKYIVFPDSIPYVAFLNQIDHAFASQTGLYIYKNKTALPRAWFVSGVQKVAPADSILSLMSIATFDPRRVAYVEEEIGGVQAPDSASVVQTKAEMHELAYEVSTDKDAFLVLSEIYYPAGWKAYLGETEIPIHAANYALRGLKIPAGKHQLRLVFAPDSYKQGVRLSFAGLILSLLALLGGLGWSYFKSKRIISSRINP